MATDTCGHEALNRLVLEVESEERASEEAFEPASIGCASHAFSSFRSVYKAPKRTFERREQKLTKTEFKPKVKRGKSDGVAC